MNYGRIAAAAVVAWIVSIALGFLINGVLFTGLLAANAAAMRPEAVLNSMLPLGFAASLLGFLAFAYAFARGHESGNGVAEGVRFGLVIAVLMIGGSVVWDYIVYPISGTLAVTAIILNLIVYPIYGAIVGKIYKPLPKPAARSATV